MNVRASYFRAITPVAQGFAELIRVDSKLQRIMYSAVQLLVAVEIVSATCYLLSDGLTFTV